MKEHFDVTIRSLRRQGYAVTIFTPEELKGVDPRKVEELVGEYGCDVIATAPKDRDFEDVANKMIDTMDTDSLLDYVRSSLIEEMSKIPGMYEEYLKQVSEFGKPVDPTF